MRRAVVLVDWRRGLLSYVEAPEEALREFEKIVDFCGGKLEQRYLPCISSLASRLGVNSILYITDLYGAANRLAFELRVPRSQLLQKAWRHLESILCRAGPIECGEEVGLECCEPCGWACRLAEVLGAAKTGVEVDLRGEILAKLRGEV